MRTQRRLTAAITLGLYVLSAVLFPHAAEANFWAERRNAVVRDSSLTARYPANAGNELLSSFPALNRVTQSPALSSSVVENLPKGFADKYAPLLNALPPQYGSIRKVSLPLTDPRAESSEPRVVIHIQDVHRNREAQENIAAAVQELINHDQAGLVALEGAFEPMDLKRFREFPRKDTMKIVADEMLAKDEISGPVHTALLSAHEIPAVEGVDDPRSYDANVAAYRRSVILQPDYKARIADAEKSLAREEEGIFHAALKEFEAPRPRSSA